MKIVKTLKAVGAGISDYAKQSNAANMQAEKNLAGTFGRSSENTDIGSVVAETKRIKKEKGISLKNSISSKLGI